MNHDRLCFSADLSDSLFLYDNEQVRQVLSDATFVYYIIISHNDIFFKTMRYTLQGQPGPDLKKISPAGSHIVKRTGFLLRLCLKCQGQQKSM